MSEKLSSDPQTGTPEIGRSLDSRSPLITRVEGDERQIWVRKALRAALVAGGLAAVGAAAGTGWAVFGSRSSSDVGISSGPCVPGENRLDCLDRLHDEEVAGHTIPAVLPGLDVDGCSVLSDSDQLRSPLCCPVVSRNPSACPRPLPGMGMSVEDGRAVIVDADDLVPASEAPSE